MTQEQFSIIVPVRGPVGPFEDSLASVLRTRPDSAQVMVVHGNSYQDPYNLAGEVEIYNAGNEQSLIGLWNFALAHARGKWIVWIHPGVEFNEGWDWEISDEFENPQIGCLVPPIFGTHSRGTTRQKRLACFGTLWNGHHPIEPITQESDLPVKGSIETSSLLLPSPLVAIFRNSALGWLEPIDSTLPECALSSEWGLSLKAIGFNTITSTSTFATSEWSETLIEELQSNSQSSSMATAFERTLSRYSPQLIPGRRRRAYQHVLRQFWQPSAWRYAGEILRADRFVASDQSYRDRLNVAAQRREKLQPWSTDISVPSKTTPIREHRTRRAA